MWSPMAPHHSLPHKTWCSHQHRLLRTGIFPLCPKDPGKRPPAGSGTSWACVGGDQLVCNLPETEAGTGWPTSESPTHSLHFPLVVKGQPVVGRELMAQKDFTETLSETVCQAGFFFLSDLFSYPPKSAFLSLFYGRRDRRWGERECKQIRAFTGGSWQSGPGGPRTPAGDPRTRVKARAPPHPAPSGQTQWVRLRNKKTSRARNNCVCAKRYSFVAL